MKPDRLTPDLAISSDLGYKCVTLRYVKSTAARETLEVARYTVVSEWLTAAANRIFVSAGLQPGNVTSAPQTVVQGSAICSRGSDSLKQMGFTLWLVI